MFQLTTSTTQSLGVVSSSMIASTSRAPIVSPEPLPVTPAKHDQNLVEVLGEGDLRPHDMSATIMPCASPLKNWNFPATQPKVYLPSPKKTMPLDTRQMKKFQTREELNDIMDRVSDKYIDCYNIHT